MALQASGGSSILPRSTKILMLRASVMVARWAHNPEGRFDSEATQPKFLFPSSSAVEQQAVNLLVRGSIPRWGAKFFKPKKEVDAENC